MSAFNKLIKNRIHGRHIAEVLFTLLLVFIYTFLGKYLLPDGVNAIFAQRTSSLLLVPLIVFLGIFLFLLNHISRKKDTFFRKIDSLDYKDIILLLLPMTPITQYILLNQDILSPFSSLVVFMLFLALAFILAILVPWALSVIASKKALMTVGLSVTFLLYNMSALSAHYSWYLHGSLKIQLIYLSLTFLLLYGVLKINNRFSYLLVTAFFFINTTVTLINKDNVTGSFESSPAEKENEISAYLDTTKIARTPDIFLLIYEAYANAETMMKYGFDNCEQIQFLKQNGFTI